MSQLTKQALANELKKKMQVKPLDKITVKELVEACNLNRQTFYYHFQDIYELLDWIYRSEALESIKNYRSYDTWEQGLTMIFEYIMENQLFCVNTCRSLGREHLESFLNYTLFELLGNVMDEIPASTTLEESKRNFIIQFYSYAFSNTILAWIEGGMKTDYHEIADNIVCIMDGAFDQAIQHFQ